MTLLAALIAESRVRFLGAETTNKSRESRDFNSGWRFQLGDTADAKSEGFDDSSWRALNLPHDWSIEGEYAQDNPGGAFTAYLPTGVGWYRRSFEVPAAWRDKRVSLQFDAIFMNSTVWMNGAELGTRPYGYISFVYDLTPHLKAGMNVVAVKVDNSKQPAARWYTGSGIYAHVRLCAMEAVHVAQWGVFVSTQALDDGKAQLLASIELCNETRESADVEVAAEVVNPEGRIAARSQSVCQIAPTSVASAEQTFIVSRPDLWSPESPSMYQLRLKVSHDGSIVDEYEIPFGIRTATFDADRGFLLNGEPLKLHGVADHYCAAAVGAAIPDALLEWQLRMHKEMGVNAIRTAHHPRPPIFYDLCDRMGLMVMNEFFDGWHKKAAQDYGARFFDTWWRRDATDCVRRDRNHPCVIAWSIGNETGTKDTFGIAALVHSMDETRLVTGGQVIEGVDVAGFNGPGGVPGTLEKYHEANPHCRIVLTEEPHTLQTRGFYRVLTWWRDKDRPRYDFPAYGTAQIFTDGNEWYNSSYDNACVRMTARTSLKRTQSWPWLAGEFRWSGFDYLGEAGFTGSHWPARMWNYGVIDLGGIPKDHFYLYKASWTKKPMVHLLPHWTHPGMEGTTIPVVAYSNANEVELILNDESLGRKRPSALGDFVWKVPYRPGKLHAVAYIDSRIVAETAFRTAGPPSGVALKVNKSGLRPNRRDIAVLTCWATDGDGVPVPWSMNRVEFKMAGPVRTLGFENGDPLDTMRNAEPCRRLFYGFCRGFFQGTSEAGPIEVTSFGILGDELFPVSTTVAIASQRIALRGQLRKSAVDIRFTIDGSRPDGGSRRYEQPFQVTESTTVRALLLRDGLPFLNSEARFLKGEKPVVTDPRWQGQGAVGAYAGPFDAHVVGRWLDGDMAYELKPGGTVMRIYGTDAIPKGFWWYSISMDAFESNDLGHGQMRLSSGSSDLEIQLTNRAGDVLRLRGSQQDREWKRAR